MKYTVRKIRKQEKYILKSINGTGDIVSTHIYNTKDEAYQELRKRVKEDSEKNEENEKSETINLIDSDIEDV